MLLFFFFMWLFFLFNLILLYMLICFAIGLGIVKGEETNHIVEFKRVEKKNKER